jgi:hypothetical protein
MICPEGCEAQRRKGAAVCGFRRWGTPCGHSRWRVEWERLNAAQKSLGLDTKSRPAAHNSRTAEQDAPGVPGDAPGYGQLSLLPL